MAEVFLATTAVQADFEHRIVVKRMLPELCSDPEFMSMFVDEAKLVSHLNHPNIVAVLELGVIEHQYFIAMEYVDGCDLATLLASQPTLPVAVACGIARATLLGLHHAYTRTVLDDHPLCLVHRDVSPHNILLSREGFAKIGDFGVAKARLRATRTRTGTLKGRFAYMSPEHARSEALGPTSDAYSVALVLYEMITGQPARSADHDAEMLALARSGATPDFANVPERLAPILKQALAAHEHERFPSAAAFAAALPPGDDDALGRLVDAASPQRSETFQTSGRVSLREAGTPVVGEDSIASAAPGSLEFPSTVIVAPSAPLRKYVPQSVFVACVVFLGLLATAGAVVLARRQAASTAARAEPVPAASSSTPAEDALIELPPPLYQPNVEKGRLTLNAFPWAHVWVDGKRVAGNTPLRRLELSAGKHRIRLASPGTGLERELEVDIESGLETFRVVKMQNEGSRARR
jgi:eukaryotic-like serine/threonine-protein kinase